MTMKLPVLLALILAAQSPAVDAPHWKLTWSDEFNAPAGTPPDPKNWSFAIGAGGYGNKELESYTDRPANVQQTGGNLVITSLKEDYTGPDNISAHYTSARIRTQGHFAQAYGRFEARIKLPLGKGIWPAFWLLGDNQETAHWPNCGEIDILENIGEPAIVHSTIHGPGYSGGKGITAQLALPSGQQVNTDFHLYAVEWAPKDIKFFVDNILIAERTPADLPAGTTWVFDHPFSILLNLAVGGAWPGYPDETTTFPQQMRIDYVRVYTRAS
jgi:beta-glucanase (GH16 family)